VPHRAVMVGDNFRTDIVGPSTPACAAVWLQPAAAKCHPLMCRIRPERHIRDLSELPAAIRRCMIAPAGEV